VRILHHFAPDEMIAGSLIGRKIDRVEFENGVVWNATDLQNKVDSVVNHAPILVKNIPDQTASVGSLFTYTVASDSIIDQDAGDKISYYATMADGSNLPTWLSFDRSTLTSVVHRLSQILVICNWYCGAMIITLLKLARQST